MEFIINKCHKRLLNLPCSSLVVNCVGGCIKTHAVAPTEQTTQITKKINVAFAFSCTTFLSHLSRFFHRDSSCPSWGMGGGGGGKVGGGGIIFGSS